MFNVHENPYRSLAESVVTSNVLLARDAFDLTVSWHTTAGSSSTFSVQLSNALDREAIGEATWSTFTSIVPSGSDASTLALPLGYRFVRILRTVSGSSLSFNVNKTVHARS